MNPSPAEPHSCHNTADIIEFGVIIHATIIGISVGAWKESRGALIIFTVAMAFHQLFEGIGLGTVVANPSLNLSRAKQIIMILVFSLSFPISICIGIYLCYSSTDPADYALISGASPRPSSRASALSVLLTQRFLICRRLPVHRVRSSHLHRARLLRGRFGRS